MSNVSDKNCVFNKMAIHQKRKASFRGTRTQNICFIMTLFYSTLNVFSGSINYLSEGALIQPTLSFSTTGSHSSGKTRYYFYIRYFCNNIDFLNVYRIFLPCFLYENEIARMIHDPISTYYKYKYLFKDDFIFFCIFIRSRTKNVRKLENNSKAFLSQFVFFIIMHKG